MYRLSPAAPASTRPPRRLQCFAHHARRRAASSQRRVPDELGERRRRKREGREHRRERVPERLAAWEVPACCADLKGAENGTPLSGSSSTRAVQARLDVWALRRGALNEVDAWDVPPRPCSR